MLFIKLCIGVMTNKKIHQIVKHLQIYLICASLSIRGVNMKVGIRKPSIKRSVKARTTGRAKRVIKSAVNPFYGKKGTGYISNPKKAVYNKVYKKTSISAVDLIKKIFKP